MIIEKKLLKELKPAPYNPRQSTEKQETQLKRSLEKFGVVEPIIFNKQTGFIVGGHFRVRELKKLGYKEIECVIVDLNEDDEKELNIRLNANTGEWDFEMLSNEWDVEQLEEWGLDMPTFEADQVLEATEDDFDTTPPAVPITVLGDLYEIGEHRLLCGDSTDSDQVAKLMNGEKADMVFTDPPYNIDYQGIKDKRDKIANDKMSDENFTQFLYDALNIDCDTFYVCCSWQYSHLFREAMTKLLKPVKSFIIWNKVNPAQHLDKYYKQHEIILYHGKFGGEKTLRGDIWECKRQKNTLHPTMKPIELISLAITDNPNKIKIYDAFLGSGSTMVASHQLKRKCYGMELDPKYCDVIVKRMVKLDPTLIVKRNGVDVTNEWK